MECNIWLSEWINRINWSQFVDHEKNLKHPKHGVDQNLRVDHSQTKLLNRWMSRIHRVISCSRCHVLKSTDRSITNRIWGTIQDCVAEEFYWTKSTLESYIKGSHRIGQDINKSIGRNTQCRLNKEHFTFQILIV